MSILDEYNNDFVKHIDDSNLIDELARIVDGMIVRPDDFRADWIRAKNWKVGLVLDDLYSADHKHIASILGKRYSEDYFGVVTEDITRQFDRQRTMAWCFHVDMCAEGIEQFDRIFRCQNAVLFPKSISCALFREAVDYYGIAGPLEVVEEVLGMSMPEIREAYIKECMDTIGPDNPRRLLLECNEYYAQFD